MAKAFIESVSLLEVDGSYTVYFNIKKGKKVNPKLIYSNADRITAYMVASKWAEELDVDIIDSNELPNPIDKFILVAMRVKLSEVDNEIETLVGNNEDVPEESYKVRGAYFKIIQSLESNLLNKKYENNKEDTTNEQ